VFVAGIVLAGVCFEVARRRVRPVEIALLLGLTPIGMILVGVAVLLVGFGLWLVHLGGIRRLLRRATTASGVRPSRREMCSMDSWSA
jgi:hypothetical protein